MGDSLKLSKDKRHRSSSSIAGAGLDGTRSERKLEIRALIPEVDDHFTVAESRCDDLQEKIDLVKLLKRKKKLNKRSMTRVSEAPAIADNMHFISVRTQPKKKVSQQGARTRRVEVAPNPVRGYVDSATVEQHRMLGQVWGYGHNYKNQTEFQPDQKSPRNRPRRNRADGDGMCGITLAEAPNEVACGQDDTSAYSDMEIYDRSPEDLYPATDSNMFTMKKRKNINRKNEAVDNKSSTEATNLPQNRPLWKNLPSGRRRQKQQTQQNQQQIVELNNVTASKAKIEERPVVELFNKGRSRNSSPLQPRQMRPVSRKEDKRTIKNVQEGGQGLLNAASDVTVQSIKKPVRRKMRNRNYELPTVASQLKQVDARYHCCVANCANIPFVVSKSTAPSHNIGVNIQQLLNGVKMQQPVNGIPMTIAHHMGLGHVSTYRKANKPPKPSVNKSLINAITVGRRMLTLPSYRCISYNRILSMFREGDGMVPRFLRAISRPNYIYTSMYDLNRREEIDGASTTRGRCDRVGAASVDDDTRRRLTEYADIYSEYEKVDAMRKQGGQGSVEAERRCDELLHELLAREEVIKQVYERSTVPRKTLTTTTLAGNISAKTERDSYHRPQISETVNFTGMPTTVSTNELRVSTGALSEARRNRDQT